MLRREVVHPGVLVILPAVRRDRQKVLFGAALYAITDHDPPLDMVNTVLEVDANGTVVMYPLPDDG